MEIIMQIVKNEAEAAFRKQFCDAQEIGKFKLTNFGGFACRLGCQWKDSSGQTQRDFDNDFGFDVGQSRTVDPGDFGCPEGSLVWIFVYVIWGNDKVGKQPYIYKKGSSATACYVISGTTLNDPLTFDEITK
jgi:hypothetical protein